MLHVRNLVTLIRRDQSENTPVGLDWGYSNDDHRALIIPVVKRAYW